MTYFILIIVYFVCLHIRTGYELLKEAGKVNLESKLVFWIIFSVMCILWISWFAGGPLDPFQIDLPEPVRWGGFALFLIGTGLAVGGLVTLRGLENIDHLVTSGLFSRLRHPMYTGFILWIVGWSVFHSAPASFAVGLIGIANVFYWRRLEEVRLLARYGNVYLQYQATSWF